MGSQSVAPQAVRRRSNGIRTRAEIITTAERLFAERGFEATRLEDIATEVAIRRAGIFYYFRDKQELYKAVLDQVFADWTAALPTAGSAAERLEASLIGWIDYIAQRPSVARLILREAATANPGVISQFVRSGSAPVEWFRTVIEEGIAAGQLKPIIEPHRFMSLIGGVTVFHFAAMPWLSLRSKRVIESRFTRDPAREMSTATSGSGPPNRRRPQDSAVDPWSRKELEKHKQEILLIARTMLGIKSPKRPR